jgi:predicted transcriptional regulator
MKSKEREEARRLRHEGYSVKEICQTLGVAKSSVSVWVRDIELTSEQRNRLIEKGSPRMRGRFDGAEANARKHLELRREYQEAGRLKAREQDPLHIAGCMLYWAEGRKARNRLELVNSDADLLKFYMKFLRESLDAPNDKMKIHVNCYLGNGIELTEIEDYWLKILDLSKSHLGKSVVNAQPTSSQQKGRKLLYGVCKLSVQSTELVQHVFGAIQEYSGIDKPEWLL